MTRDELERRLGRALNMLTTGADRVPTDPDMVLAVAAAMSAIDEYAQAYGERIAQAIESFGHPDIAAGTASHDFWAGFRNAQGRAARIARAGS